MLFTNKDNIDWGPLRVLRRVQLGPGVTVRFRRSSFFASSGNGSEVAPRRCVQPGRAGGLEIGRDERSAAEAKRVVGRRSRGTIPRREGSAQTIVPGRPSGERRTRTPSLASSHASHFVSIAATSPGEDTDLFDEGASGASRPSRNATGGLAIKATVVEGRGEGGTRRLPFSDGTSASFLC